MFQKVNFWFAKYGLHSYRGERKVPSISELTIFVLYIKMQLAVHF